MMQNCASKGKWTETELGNEESYGNFFESRAENCVEIVVLYSDDDDFYLMFLFFQQMPDNLWPPYINPVLNQRIFKDRPPMLDFEGISVAPHADAS